MEKQMSQPRVTKFDNGLDELQINLSDKSATKVDQILHHCRNKFINVSQAVAVNWRIIFVRYQTYARHRLRIEFDRYCVQSNVLLRRRTGVEMRPSKCKSCACSCRRIAWQNERFWRAHKKCQHYQEYRFQRHHLLPDSNFNNQIHLNNNLRQQLGENVNSNLKI